MSNNRKKPIYITLKSATEPDETFLLTMFKFLSKTLYTASLTAMIFKNYKLICVIISDFVYDSLDISSHMFKSLNHMADFNIYKALRF